MDRNLTKGRRGMNELQGTSPRGPSFAAAIRFKTTYRQSYRAGDKQNVFANDPLIGKELL